MYVKAAKEKFPETSSVFSHGVSVQLEHTTFEYIKGNDELPF
jgi:hypothetical protein